jgi:hypothetical protein
MYRNRFFSKILLTSCMLFLSSIPDAMAGDKSITWYLDGAKIEQELVLDNSYKELILPAAMQPGSLRIRPLPGTRISRVDLEPVKPGKSEEKELSRLDERREELQDRLKALAVKEEIFKATAKSQGSKAPRRTRTNPEPLSAIRQGTDYAISRLEDVYRATRNVERELKELDRKQAVLKKNEKISGTVAKIRIEGKRGRVQLSYLTTGEGWTPFYDIRISAGFAELTLMATVPAAEKGVSSQVITSLISSGVYPSPVRIGTGNVAKVASYRLPVLSEKILQTLQKSFAVTLRNDSGVYLPPGESSGYLQEEFIGYTRVGGMKPSESADLVFGVSAGRVPDLKGSQ